MGMLPKFAENLGNGVDVELHNYGKVGKAISTIAGTGLVAGAAASLLALRLMTPDSWPLYWRYNVARLADALALGNNRLLDIAGRVPADFVSEFGQVYHDTFFVRTPIGIAVGAAVGYYAARWLARRAAERNVELEQDEFLRGVQDQTKEELVAKVEAEWAAAEAKAKAEGYALPNKYTFAGVPLPPGMAQRNILATGGMGSGKSVAIFDLADQVAAAGKTMIVYDKVTEFASYYYREGIDIIFNPFDARCPGWNLFSEISHVYEFDQMAAYLIPTNEKASGTEDYFKSAARTIFACILQKLWEEGRTNPARRTNEALCRAIFETGQDALYVWLKGTPAESLLNPDSKGTGGGGVLSTLTEAVKVLRYVPSGDFSLKDFVRQAGDRRIFITSKEEVHEIVKPLTAMAMGILYTTVMAGEQVHEDKFWFFLDEFKSMGKLPIFPTAVTEGRKYGAVACVGAQNTMQFEAMFGKETAVSIRSNLQNSLILRVADHETQETYSKEIGAGEYDEHSSGISWGLSANKDGSSINTARKERRQVLASEIKKLPDRTGFLQLAGEYDAARVSYDYKKRKVIAAGWMPRSNLALATSAPAEAAAPAATSAAPAAKKRSVF